MDQILDHFKTLIQIDSQLSFPCLEAVNCHKKRPQTWRLVDLAFDLQDAVESEQVSSLSEHFPMFLCHMMEIVKRNFSSVFMKIKC